MADSWWPFRAKPKPVAASAEDWSKIYDEVEKAHSLWRRMAWMKQGRNPRAHPPSDYNNLKRELGRTIVGWNKKDERAIRRAHNLVLAIHQIKDSPGAQARIDGWRSAILKIVTKQPEGRPVGNEIRFE